jgi:hypothetical protein
VRRTLPVALATVVLARIALAALALGLAGLASAAAPDWGALRDVQTVEVVTTDPDGESRDTTVWLVVVDGAGYLRTGGTRWCANVERTPDLVLRVGEQSYPLRAEFVEDDALRQRILDAFREKYGFGDRAASLIRFGRTRLMRLVPRE